MKNTIEIPVEFGHTDPAAIVYYPNFFKWFDAGTWRLLMKVGLTLDVMRKEYASAGLLPAGAQARFYVPIRFGDTISLTSFVSAWNRRTVDIAHQIFVDEKLCADGSEIRVLGQPSSEDPQRFQAAEIPEELKRRLPAYRKSA